MREERVSHIIALRAVHYFNKSYVDSLIYIVSGNASFQLKSCRPTQ